MDFATHALTGMAFAYTVPKSMRSCFLPLYAAIITLLPDADILIADTPMAFLLWHRGPTHSLAAVFLGALVLAFFMRPFCGKGNPSQLTSRNASSGDQWSLFGTWIFILILLLMHIWLDVSNHYGTQVFWPITDIRVYMDTTFIIDILLLLPLMLGILFYRQKRGIMILLCLWVFSYPLINLGIRLGAESYLTSVLAKREDTRNIVHEVHLLPDGFAPLHWNLILDTDDAWLGTGYTLFGTLPPTFIEYKKPDPALWQALGDSSDMFRIYDLFTRFTMQHPTRVSTFDPALQEIQFSDLRFTSYVPFVQKMKTKYVDNGEIPFSFTARIDANGRIIGVRTLMPQGSGGDSGWHTPQLAFP